LTPEYPILPLLREDLPGVLEIEKSSFSNPWTLLMFEQELKLFNSHFCVLKEKESASVLGYAGFWHIIDEAHIVNLAVHPQHREKGYGKILLRELIKKMLNLRCGVVYLEVRESNTGARRLYERAGFEMAGRRKKYYNEPSEDAVIYFRKLREEETE